MMSMHDRYYEPEDGDDYEDMEEYVLDWIQYEMRAGGRCDPTTQINFGEYLCETGQEDKAVEDATEADKQGSIQYWENIARMFAEEAYDERND